ncbi:pyridoxal phosphate-dependent aminotransferase [Parvularcula dongshanensis]|uniref:Histidinol-phosphate aminotransferase n=1 Tax=Parvularcula dongshanensis TaxID=1173995 RepID=A0A840I8Z9_9PROT|nr:histidinol-phosphate transaminase [Parvularcula dongshanensis]MBB4660420.1 histidinol-phosphate aminotransferase [Parvularcula dongshanensis]
MTVSLSRRSLLGRGAAGAAAIGAALAPAARARECGALAPGRKESLYGPDPRTAHLVFNENPFGPSPKALEALAEASTQGAYYQGKSVAYLAEMIAERHGVGPEQILITNGSYEGLTALGLAYAKKGDILGPELFWDSTALFVENNGYGRIVRAPMKGKLEVDLAALEARVGEGTGMVHIVNPNNPTGRLIDPSELRSFCTTVSPKTMVLIDEAYIELSDDPDGNSMMDLVRAGQNVVVARTFSKIYGMAGLRVGYAIGPAEVIQRAQNFVVSSPNVAGISAAIASYDDEAFLKTSKSKLLQARQMIMEGTKAMGLDPLPSQTSFVFVDVGMDADAFRARMAEKGVVIRGKYGEHTPYSRVSCGYAEDVKRYLEAIPYAMEA